MRTTTHTKLTTFLVVTVALMALLLPGKAMAQDAYLGEIRMFAGNFAPRGWAFCDGQLLQISQNAALFSLLGTTYGGDGRITFALPDLRGRVAIHPGQGPGLSNYPQGARGGVETVTLSAAQMPSHNHTATVDIPASSGKGTQATPGVPAAGRNFYGPVADSNLTGSVAVNNTGGSQAHTNIQPYNTVRFIIALQGIFPPRN